MNEVQQEIERIIEIADRLYADYPTEREWEQMLTCLLRHLPARYFFLEAHDRKTVQELLTPDLKTQAILTWQFAAVSGISDFLKHRVCSACQSFLRRIGTDEADLDELKKVFDPASYNVFEGLE